jgi:molybdate transport system substrate-binding protein
MNYSMKKKLFSTFYLALTLTLVGCSSNAAENGDKIEITISAAASLNDVLTEIESIYEKENKNINLLFNFGGSGSLQQQIAQGAPVDLFFSAAEEKFDLLLEQELIDTDYQIDLIGNKLTLIIPKESKAHVDNIQDLLSDEIERIAIGTPETVPAGLYSKQVFQNLQIWDKLEEKLIPTKDVRQVLSYVETNNVDAGIVYQTDAILSKKVTIVDALDSNLHDQIVYPVGVIDDAANKAETIEFFDFLRTETALGVFEKFGFEIVVGINE